MFIPVVIFELIPYNVQGGTEFHICFLICDTISDDIISDIDVAITLATWSSSIILQFGGTLINLIDNIVIYIVSIIFKEVSGTYHLYQDIAHPGKLGPGWTLSV